MVKGIGAAIDLGEATAEAVARIPDAHCNGDMHAALKYARNAKHEQKDFLTQQGSGAIFLKSKEGFGMRKVNWKRNLTSRKLWTATASFVSMIVVACGGTGNTAAQVTALIMAGVSVGGYIIGEGMTDVANMGVQEGGEK